MLKPVFFILLVSSFFPARSQTNPAPVKQVLINNVQIFNGKDEKLMTGNVLIVNNLISKISAAPIPTNKSGETKIIDGKGKFLMPGLIDNHMHMILAASPCLKCKMVILERLS